MRREQTEGELSRRGSALVPQHFPASSVLLLSSPLFFLSSHVFPLCTPPPFPPPIHIHLHSGLIVSSSGLPLQLAIHLGSGGETAPDLSHCTKERYMRMPPVAVCGKPKHRHIFSIRPPCSLQCQCFCSTMN